MSYSLPPTNTCAALKKRQGKTGEESRYQGSVLGKDAELQGVNIVGGPVTKISEWRRKAQTARSNSIVAGATPATSGISSVPMTPGDGE
jgi:transcription initiation factor TFIID subunit 3